jgi:YfiH family protein
MTAFSFDSYDEILSLTCKPINWPGVIRHAFSTRCGGSSKPPYASLNMGFGSGDSRTCVLRNRASFGLAVGFDPNDLLTLRQVHGNHVMVLDTVSDRWRTQGMPGDGLMTNRPHLPLGVITADCFPIMLTLPHLPAVGVLHAGRRGTADHLVPMAIAQMCRQYGATAAEVFAAIGPGIGGCCYEVDADSAAPFIGQFPALVGVYRPSRPGAIQNGFFPTVEMDLDRDAC